MCLVYHLFTFLTGLVSEQTVQSNANDPIRTVAAVMIFINSNMKWFTPHVASGLEKLVATVKTSTLTFTFIAVFRFEWFMGKVSLNF